jgi:hypothetical protein
MNLDQVGELLEEILEKGPESIQKIEEVYQAKVETRPSLCNRQTRSCARRAAKYLQRRFSQTINNSSLSPIVVPVLRNDQSDILDLVEAALYKLRSEELVPILWHKMWANERRTDSTGKSVYPVFQFFLYSN